MNFLMRLLTAVILLPLIIADIHFGGFVFSATVVVAAVLVVDEIFTMGLGKGHPLRMFVWLISCVYMLFVVTGNAWLGLWGVWFFVFVFGVLLTFKPLVKFEEAARFGFVLLVSIYAFLGLASFFYLREGISGNAAQGRAFIYLALICTFSSDTFAYLVGKLFGRHPLFPSVSQKKTWEGFFAGAAAAIAMPFLVEWAFNLFGISIFSLLTLTDLLFVSLGISFLAPLGDLIESRLKRAFDVKDSGSLLPGHGGLFDRIDALLVTVPFTLCYAFFIRPL